MANVLKKVPWRKVFRWVGKALINAAVEKGEQIVTEKPKKRKRAPSAAPDAPSN